MSRGFRFVLGAILAAGAAGGVWVAVATGKPTIRVNAGGRVVAVGAGTTAAQAARRFGLEARAGDLLDVEGHVLRAGAFPGRLLVDGRPAAGRAVLQDGDRLAVRDGVNRTEPLKREVEQASLRRPANPQFYVELFPGRSVVTRGAVSHRLVSARFVPGGPARLDNAVALTFDDGPSEYTRRIVDLLARLHVPATFFVIAEQAKEYPELVRLEADSGMAVGNHSYDHPWRSPFASLPKTRIRAEIDDAQAVLQRIGVDSVLFRPPGGTYSPFVLRAAAAEGMRVVLWSVDARDWAAGATAQQIEERVLGAVQPGSIVVMHDGGGDRSATLEALPAIVAGIRRAGLALVALAPLG